MMKPWKLVFVMMMAGCAGGGGTSDSPDIAGDISVDFAAGEDVGTVRFGWPL